MEKRICAKFCRLPNVVGRVDYISNPKRQENLRGFYQTPEDPTFFWRALSDETRELASYNKEQIEEHNRIEKERFDKGEIKKKNLWFPVEARENILCLPNDICGKMDPQKIAQFIALDIKERLEIECAVGVHMNKKGTNFHAHIIMSERTLLQKQRVSIATKNTYYNAAGKRSSKKECVDENGNLKSGCRLVKKGENLSQRRFTEKDPRFASKGFCYGEKKRYAELFNKWSKDKWVVYSHYKNPHMRLYNLKRGEPAGLRAWKKVENEKIRAYNRMIDRLMTEEYFTVDEALALKKQIYAERRAEREVMRDARKTYVNSWSEEEQLRREEDYAVKRWISCREDGTRRGFIELFVILGMVLCGVDLKMFAIEGYGEIDENLHVEPATLSSLHVERSNRIQEMVDDLARAAGRRTATAMIEEYRLYRKVETKKTSSLNSLVSVAERQQTTVQRTKERVEPELYPDRER